MEHFAPDLFPAKPRTVRSTTRRTRHGLACRAAGEWETPGGILVYRDEDGVWNVVQDGNVVESVGYLNQAAAVALRLDTSGAIYRQAPPVR